MKNWAGPDGEIGQFLENQWLQTLNSYESQPLLIVEHANQEQDTARGGYADRQVVELVQNAADQLSDGVGGRIELRLTDRFLYCADDGEPFDTEGVKALLFSYLSPKRGNDKIGRFGIGFKSVLGVTSRPEVFSRTGSFRFDADWAAGQIRSVVPDAGRTPILRLADPIDPGAASQDDAELRALMNWATNIIRLPIGQQVAAKLSKQLSEFRAEFLLFVDHVERMDLLDDSVNVVRKLRLSRSAERIQLDDNGKESEWRVFHHVHPLSETARADSRTLDQGQTVPIAWAAPLNSRNDMQEFWAFFPTQTSSYVAGILNAFWKTNEDRQSLLPGPYNDELLEGAAKLIAESLPALSTPENPAAHLDVLPRREESWDNNHANHLRKCLNEALNEARVVPDQDGTLRPISEIRVAPDELTPRQSVLQEPTETWASYAHRPVDWLHHSALGNERLSALARISDRGESQRGALKRASVSEWLEALVESGRKHDDEIGASRVAIQVAAQMMEAGATTSAPAFGRILLSASGNWEMLSGERMFLRGEYASDDERTVHPELNGDATVVQALKIVGIGEPSGVSVLRLALQELAAPDHPWRNASDKSKDKVWTRFWEHAREIGNQEAASVISRHPQWRKDVYVKAANGEWYWAGSMLRPGLIVPADGSRDDETATDAEFHKPDDVLFETLGINDGPDAQWDHRNGDANEQEQLAQHRDACARDFRQRAEHGKPLIDRLNFRSSVSSGPLGAFKWLSAEGAVAFTSALLELDSTYQTWTMRHDTQERYGTHMYPSLAVQQLRELGRIQTSDGIEPLADGLGSPPASAEVQRVLLTHPKTTRIRAAFPDLATIPDDDIEAIGEDEPVPFLDEWPGISAWRSFDEDLELVRCDRLLARDGTPFPFDCVPIGSALFVRRGLSEEEELRAILREIGVSIPENRLEEVIEGRARKHVEAARAHIRECGSDAERLLDAVGEENLIERLPQGLVDILEMEAEPFEGERVAEAAIATFHTGALHAYRDFLDDLHPPHKWAGGRAAVEFVTDLGFAPEWAGRPTPKRAPFEDVRAPYKLPPLHDYQEKAVANIRDALRARRSGGENRGLLSLPTGAGKTRVTVEAVIDAIRDGEVDGTVLWIADRDELCEQAVESWQQAWGAIGPEAEELRISRMWGGQNRPVAFDGAHVVVATMQTLGSRGVRGGEAKDPLNDVGLLVVDEAHGSIAPTYTQIMRELGLTFRRREDEIGLLGLTATPYRGFNAEETARLAARYGRNRLDTGAFKSSDANRMIGELQHMTVLAQADHQIIPGGNVQLTDEELRQMKERGFSWLPGSAQDRLGDDRERTRGIVEAYKRWIGDKNPDWPTLIFATSVSHAQTVAALLQLDGIEARAVSGETETAARRSAVEQFRSGELKVLVNYGVFREGFDAPKTRAIIVARPVYSPNLYFQMIGRGLRGVLNGGSERCLVLDVKDNVLNYDGQLAFTELDWLWAN